MYILILLLCINIHTCVLVFLLQFDESGIRRFFESIGHVMQADFLSNVLRLMQGNV